MAAATTKSTFLMALGFASVGVAKPIWNGCSVAPFSGCICDAIALNSHLSE